MNHYVRSLRKSFLVSARKERLTAHVYAAMVDGLYGTLVGYAALAAASMILAVLCFTNSPGRASGAMLAAMTIITVLRVVLMAAYQKWKRHGGGPVNDVVMWEIAYAVVGVAMMMIIGVICAYIVRDDRDQLPLIVAVVVAMGIAGCIAGRNGSRPKLVSHQLAAVFVPFVAALLVRGSLETIVIAALVIVYYFATMSSTRAVYATLRNALVAERQNKDLSRRIKCSADLFDTALNNMTSGLMLFDRRRRLVVANEKVRELIGRELIDGMMGRSTSQVSRNLYAAYGVTEAEAAEIDRGFLRIVMEGGEDSLFLHDRVRARTFEFRLRTIPDQGVVFNIDDITEKQSRDREIRRLAHHDGLTDLPNRTSLDHHLEQRIRDLPPGGHFVVMYMDLDHFKEVNDDLGHPAGDCVLVEVAARLTRCRRAGDFVARIAGDEFVLVFTGAADAAAINRSADCSADRSALGHIADLVIEAISRPYLVSGRTVMLGASAGLSIVGGGGGGETSAIEALRTADVALYEAKMHGRGRFVWFQPMMDDRARTRREMISELRAAFEGGEGLSLAYQPIVDFRSGRVVACEALMRWTSGLFGAVPPAVFIPLAEESDLIGKLGIWSLTRACLDARQWGDPQVKVAVNLSGSQLKYGSISEQIAAVLENTGLDPARLEIEITESVLVDDFDLMAREMTAVSRLGVSIALDDFGTGYSSLSLIHKLPLDKIKLDRSFVAQLDDDPTAVSLIASIVQMTQTMRKQLVVEGVETAGQLALVASAQARLVQGFYFSRPMTQAATIAYLETDLSVPLLAMRAVA